MSFDLLSSLACCAYVAMFFELFAREDTDGLLATIVESLIGSSFAIGFRGIETSQDLCNSLHEHCHSSAAEARDGRQFEIAELGPGHGRLAYACLRALPGATYTFIDIPPFLNVDEEYLVRFFPGERVFQYRPFSDFAAVRHEFRDSRIRLLAAHPIELVLPKLFDLFVNISPLHEMWWAQIRNCLQQIDRTCRRNFYKKQWRVSQASINGLVVGEHDHRFQADGVKSSINAIPSSANSSRPCTRLSDPASISNLPLTPPDAAA